MRGPLYRWRALRRDAAAWRRYIETVPPPPLETVEHDIQHLVMRDHMVIGELAVTSVKSLLRSDNHLKFFVMSGLEELLLPTDLHTSSETDCHTVVFTRIRGAELNFFSARGADEAPLRLVVHFWKTNAPNDLLLQLEGHYRCFIDVGTEAAEAWLHEVREVVVLKQKEQPDEPT